MKWLAILVAIIAILWYWWHLRHVSTPLSPPPGFRTPAEWEPQQCVWLSWPAFPVDGGDPVFRANYDLRGSMLNFTQVLVRYVPVQMIVQVDNLTDASTWLAPVINGPYGANFNFFVLAETTGDVWVRDWGAIFIKNETANLAVAALNWSYWGYLDNIKPEYMPDLSNYLEMPYEVAKAEQVTIYANYTQSSEGGDRDVNGYGSMITCLAVELQRNPSLTVPEIEEILMSQYGVTNIIWMEQGIIDDSQAFNGYINSSIGPVLPCPCTGGHVDEFVRWVDRYTVVLADVYPSERTDPIGAANYERMSINYNILSNSRAEDGTPLTIVRIYLPPPIYIMIPPGNPQHIFYETLIYTDGTVITENMTIPIVLASSYMNFLITNNAVLVPQYYQFGRDPLTEKTDAYAIEVLQDLFPGRSIIGVRVDGININGGGMHCTSQQQPVNYSSPH